MSQYLPVIVMFAMYLLVSFMISGCANRKDQTQVYVHPTIFMVPTQESGIIIELHNDGPQAILCHIGDETQFDSRVLLNPDEVSRIFLPVSDVMGCKIR